MVLTEATKQATLWRAPEIQLQMRTLASKSLGVTQDVIFAV